MRNGDEGEFLVNQINGLFEFNQKRGSIKQFTEQTTVREKSYQSESNKHMREQNQKKHSLKASSSLTGINSIVLNKTLSLKNESSVDRKETSFETR